MLLPDFRPHHNFDESQCAYLGDGRSSTRVIVDFAPIAGYDTRVLIIATINGKGVVLKEFTV